MTLVDTHCHTGIHKYEPVESLLYQMDANGVEKAVFIQYMGNADNRYMLDCMAAHPGRFAAAMIVEKDDDGARMREWAEKGIVGIRLSANARAECADPLAQWRTADDLGLIVSAPSRPQTLLSEEFTEVIDAFPDLQIVIEHLGGVGKGAEPPYDEFKRVLKLAERPNLTMKLPGFGEFCELPCPFAHVPPLADMALEAFGPERMMWGSDFPPVSSREGYRNSLQFPLEYLSALSEDEKAWLFGCTALKVWKFGGA